ncbi:DUF5719 family protein [Sinomonas halotolerans]|uniref:DUF5719 family protein n=1 Tax=Sinomonas halotolerans TaxID=1644133 RepID=A0ABU9WUZ9_9MICC
MTKPASEHPKGSREARTGRSGTDGSSVGARRRARAAAAATVGGLIVLIGGGLAAAGSALPVPASLTDSGPRMAEVPAGDTVRACRGPAQLLKGTPVDGDAEFSPDSTIAASSVTGAVLSGPTGTVPPLELAAPEGQAIRSVPGSKAPAGSASQPRASVVAGQRATGPLAFTARAEGETAPSAGAFMAFSAGDGDLVGLAAAACTAPANDQWIVGASTLVGRTSVLTLTNSSTTPATVSLEFYGDEVLAQAPPGSRGLQVKPGGSTSLVLSAFVPDQRNLSVRVRSTGGPVAASVQQSTLRGLVPGGVEFLTPAAAPAPSQTVTGLELQDPGAVRRLAAEPGFEDAAPAVQLTVPGAVDAVVQLKVYGRSGPVPLPGGGVVTAKAGTVTEVPLAGLPAGTYSVSATADVSFTAGARVPRGTDGTKVLDFTAPGAAVRLGDSHVVPVGRDGTRALVFGVPEGRAAIRAVPVTEDGRRHAPVSLDVEGGTTAVLEAAEEAGGSPVVAYVVDASGDPAFGTFVLIGRGTSMAEAAFVPPAAGTPALPVSLGY